MTRVHVRTHPRRDAPCVHRHFGIEVPMREDAIRERAAGRMQDDRERRLRAGVDVDGLHLGVVRFGRRDGRRGEARGRREGRRCAPARLGLGSDRCGLWPGRRCGFPRETERWVDAATNLNFLGPGWPVALHACRLGTADLETSRVLLDVVVFRRAEQRRSGKAVVFLGTIELLGDFDAAVLLLPADEPGNIIERCPPDSRVVRCMREGGTQ